ncbi:nicotinamide riboside transporter PnuC [Janibacter limosus]|jgi:nicotinamide mononucleotide transporter|uniref:Nicotinamide riboside transporter PnuC n=1 Tax=Janibacter limosus TaxID=53458 RepID=A0A4P6MSH9_9MICO|nr:nicotinamide riboside transporter PnuC [Janibacter limosus]QBF45796.1 nicotinamide riboside transporter PnuC [Janibacter limosus]
MSIIEWIYSAGVDIAGYRLSLMEVIGISFGLASAVGGMLRKVWAWPIGIVGNAILFFVYIGVTMGVDDKAPLFGQSARQIFFIITSLYGWWRWRQVRQANHSGQAHAITPRWATWAERAGLAVTMVIGIVVVQQVFAMLGAGWPAPRWYFWADAWIFMGSLLATYAMARGWNEFWLIWIGVDLVGVPLLWHSDYLPTAVLYAIYAGFVLYGFFVWLRASRTERPDGEPAAGALSPAN